MKKIKKIIQMSIVFMCFMAIPGFAQQHEQSAALVEQLTNLKEENTRLKSVIEAFDDLNQQERDIIVDEKLNIFRSGMINDFKKRMKVIIKKNKKLEIELGRLQSESNKQSAHEIKSLIKKLQNTEKELTTITQENRVLRKTNLKLKKQEPLARTSRDILNELKKQLEIADEQIVVLENTNKQMRNENKRLSQEIKGRRSSEDDMQVLQRQMLMSDEQQLVLQKENTELRAELKTLNYALLEVQMGK